MASAEPPSDAQRADGAAADGGASRRAYEVRDVSGMGRGLIAKRRIELGKVILDEVPLARGSAAPAPALLLVMLTAAVSLVPYIDGQASWALTLLGLLGVLLSAALAGWAFSAIYRGFALFRQVRRLSSDDQRSYMDLDSGHAQYCPVLTELGIFRLNAVSDDARGCVCAEASLINHACVPNAGFGWDDAAGRHKVTALRQIDAGEQIAATYVDLWLPTGERRAALQRRMGFSCGCRTCVERDDAQRSESDDRRKLCAELEQSIAEQLSRGDVASAKRGLHTFRDAVLAEFGGVETAISKMAGEEIAGLSDVPKRKDDQAALPGDPRRRVVDG